MSMVISCKANFSVWTGPLYVKQVVLIENDINSRPFSTQVLACLPPLPWTLSAEDLSSSSRQDLRHLRVFSVDPPGMIINHNWIFYAILLLVLMILQLFQVVKILMMHYIAHLFRMEILKLEFVSLIYCYT